MLNCIVNVHFCLSLFVPFMPQSASGLSVKYVALVVVLVVVELMKVVVVVVVMVVVVGRTVVVVMAVVVIEGLSQDQIKLLITSRIVCSGEGAQHFQGPAV